MEKKKFWIPLPPSLNESYARGPNSFYATDALRRYKIKVQNHCLIYQHHARELRDWCVSQGKNGHFIGISIYHVFQKDRVWTQKNTPKSLDVDNRQKAAVDAIKTILQIDDKNYFAISEQKTWCNTEKEERSIVILSPFDPKSLYELDI